jgi:hypothetical protein
MSINVVRHGLRALLLAMLAPAWLGSPGGVVAAGAASEAQCAFALDVTLSPGLSYQASSGTLTTGGPTGTEDCTGPVNGHEVTGPAVFSNDGRYGTRHPDSCAAGLLGDGEGTAVEYRTFPTAAGDQHVTDRFTFHYGQPSTKGGVVSGTFEGDHCSGTFELTPTEGDCVTKPITKAHVTGHEIFRT